MNRQQRRAAERQAAKQHNPGPRPTGEFYVDVSQHENTVTLTLSEGSCVIRKEWPKHEAAIVGNMLLEASQDQPVQEKDVVTKAGIVVAKQMPG